MDRLDAAVRVTPGLGQLSGFALRLTIGLCAAVLMLTCAVSHAGPEEDFVAGRKAYQAGDVTGALKLLRAPADGGHAGAQSMLAFVLESAGLYEESVAYYRKALAQGDLDAEFGLGSALITGNGVPKDAAAARSHFERAAGRGHVLAIRWLADAAIRAQLTPGAPPAQVAAIPEGELQWVRKAATLDHLPAIDYLARAYRSGVFGAADLAQAKEFEARAEKLRYPNGRPRNRRGGSTG